MIVCSHVESHVETGRSVCPVMALKSTRSKASSELRSDNKTTFNGNFIALVATEHKQMGTRRVGRGAAVGVCTNECIESSSSTRDYC